MCSQGFWGAESQAELEAEVASLKRKMSSSGKRKVSEDATFDSKVKQNYIFDGEWKDRDLYERS